MKAFDQGMTKIAPLGEVPPDSFRTYQTGGVLLLLAHEMSEVYALDASCVELEHHATGNELIKEILDCVAPGSATDRLRPSSVKDDPAFRALPRLPCVLEDGWIWVRTD